MFITDEIRVKIKELSIISRQVYGIREKESISFKKHPKFVTDVIRDMTNISYNLSIADHVNGKDEKDLLLYAFKAIFYPAGNTNAKFLSSISDQFDKFDTNSPEVDSPILLVEQAKKFDAKNKTKLTEPLRDLIVAYAEALVMADGFQSVREFDVLETFKFWVYE
jgi:hypothetical protein